jgi:hypothetical protein
MGRGIESVHRLNSGSFGGGRYGWKS